MSSDYSMVESLNVLDEKLLPCSREPLTGFFRDGHCNTCEADNGSHTICAVMTEEFLKFSASMGNDLISPIPHYQFPGLKEGDIWCLCVSRWIEAHKAGKAPKIILEATHEKTLEYTSLDLLVKYAFNKS